MVAERATTLAAAGPAPALGARTPDLEIAVQDAAGVRAAVEGGATRVELCTALRMGGLTPSLGTVEAALESADWEPDFVHMLVRNRGGGFVYDDDDIRTMCADIRHLRAAGAAGVVVGALTPDGGIDLAALARIAEAANGLPMTFHRAIDVCDDPVRQLQRLAVMAGGGVRIEDIPALAAVVASARVALDLLR